MQHRLEHNESSSWHTVNVHSNLYQSTIVVYTSVTSGSKKLLISWCGSCGPGISPTRMTFSGRFLISRGRLNRLHLMSTAHVCTAEKNPYSTSVQNYQVQKEMAVRGSPGIHSKFCHRKYPSISLHSPPLSARVHSC